jgi:hypothetical protein
MQSSYAEQFDRDMGCTEAEWLGWLPAAMGDCPWQRTGSTAQAAIDKGTLSLRWQVMPPRMIALLRMPVLRVSFVMQGLDADQRYTFMKRFDLHMQRGGG